MKVIIERGVLLKALSHVHSVIERRNTIPVLSNVLLRAETGKLHMTGTDLDIQVVETVEARVDVPGATTVSAGLLFNIVSKLNEGSQISLEVADGRMTVIAARYKSKLPVLSAEDFPIISKGDFTNEITIKSDVLRDILQRTKFAISTEETRYYLNGIFMHAEGTTLTAAATDGHRLAMNPTSPVNGIGGMPDVIVPRKAIGEIFKLISDYDGDVQLSLSKNKIAVEIGSILLTSKLIDGTFPDYKRVIPSETKVTVRIDPKALSDAIERVSTISSEKTRSVKVLFSLDKAVISVVSPDNGSASDEVACVSDHEVEIGFNAKYMNEILSQIEGDIVEIHMTDSVVPMKIIDPTRPDSVMVLMPMRV